MRSWSFATQAILASGNTFDARLEVLLAWAQHTFAAFVANLTSLNHRTREPLVPLLMRERALTEPAIAGFDKQASPRVWQLPPQLPRFSVSSYPAFLLTKARAILHFDHRAITQAHNACRLAVPATFCNAGRNRVLVCRQLIT